MLMRSAAGVLCRFGLPAGSYGPGSRITDLRSREFLVPKPWNLGYSSLVLRQLSAVAREALGRTQARGRQRGGWRADGNSGAGRAAGGGWGSDSDEGAYSDVERERAGARRLSLAACWQSTCALC